MSDPNTPPQPQVVNIHPLDALEQVHKEIEKVAAFLNAIKLVHDIKLDNIMPSFTELEKYLTGLKKYLIGELQKLPTAPTNRASRRREEREAEKIEEMIKKNEKNAKKPEDVLPRS